MTRRNRQVGTSPPRKPLSSKIGFRVFLLLLIFLERVPAIYAETADGFFVDTGILYSIFPLGSFGNPFVGPMAAIGWHSPQGLIYSLEGGWWTYDNETDVGTLELIPLGFRVEYAAAVSDIFMLRGGLVGGAYIIRTVGKGKSFDFSPFLGPRVYIEWETPINVFRHRSLALFAGGGLDAILEESGSYRFPILEIGLRIRPEEFQNPVVRLWE